MFYKIPNKVIFTTTEHTITEVCKATYDVEVFEYKQNKLEDGGTVTLIATKLVNSKQHALLPMMLARANKMLKKTHSAVFIGNSLSHETTLTNIRGKDDMTEMDTVCKISYPHASAVFSLGECIGTNNSPDIQRMIALDDFEQAAYRNKGSRYANSRKKKVKNSKTVMLVHPRMLSYIAENTNHNIGDVIVPDPDQMMSGDVTLETALEYLISNKFGYLQNKMRGMQRNSKVNERFRTDLVEVLNNLGSISKVNSYLNKLYAALDFEIGLIRESHYSEATQHDMILNIMDLQAMVVTDFDCIFEEME